MGDPASVADTRAGEFRAKLGTRLVLWSTIALVLLAVVIMVGAFLTKDPDRILNTAQLLLSSLLPLFATWVGTVLAFYYTKENYYAHGRSG